MNIKMRKRGKVSLGEALVALLVVLVVVAIAIGLTFGIIIGLVWAICWVLGITFMLKYAVAVYLGMILFKLLLGSFK